MDIIQESFGINLKILSIFRLYSPHKSRKLNKTEAYSAYFLLAVPFTIFSFLSFPLGEEMDQRQLNLNVIVVAEFLGWLPKLLPFISRESQIKKCIHYFDTFHFTPSDEDLDVMKKCIKACRRNSKLVLSFLVPVLVSYLVKPLVIGGGYMFPVAMWLPFNAKTGFLYYMVYMYQVVAGSYLTLTGVMIDPLIGGLAYQAVTQLVVLQKNLENLSKYAEEEFVRISGDSDQKSKIVTTLLYRKIKECVRHYEAILSFIDDFKKCFSFTIFGQLASSGIALCFTCLQLSMAPSLLNFDTFLNASTTVIVLGQMYFYCYYGTLLYEENKKLSDAIYSSEWYEYDTKSRKALIIIMERAKKPTYITAGKILELSLGTFATVLKRSYSLLAVVKNYQ